MQTKLLFLLLFYVGLAQAQPMAGLHKTAIEQLVGVQYPELQMENHLHNDLFRYLKYNNVNGLVTWFFFFSNTDFCTETREIYDNVYLDSKRKELNSKYQIVKSDSWLCTYRNERYSMLLRPNKWYFVLITKKATQ